MREFEVISGIRRGNASLGETVLVPPGDDLGAISLPDGGGVVLAGVDQVIEGVHLPPDAAPERFAWKVAARSLSDVAAMAARPVGMVVAASLSPAIDAEWAMRFSHELRRIGALHQCPVIGGDIAVLPSSDSPMVFSATVLAAPDAEVSGRMVLRSGARPGDLVCVTGSFGCSLDSDGAGHHEAFMPRVDVALGLHRLLEDRLTSMIDVSDGLGSELLHLSRESCVRMVVDEARIPRRSGAGIDQALFDGEDYELCFTVSGDSNPPSLIEDVPVTVIGIVESGSGVHLSDGLTTRPVEASGWEHGSDVAEGECGSDSKGDSL